MQKKNEKKKTMIVGQMEGREELSCSDNCGNHDVSSTSHQEGP